MNVIEQALTNINVQNKPNALWRYVDDIFVAFNDKSELNICFKARNNVYNNITFTNEFECSDSLLYLDVLVKKIQTAIQTTTYWMHTHSCLYTHWTSFIPHHKNEILYLDYLTGLIKSPALPD